MRGLKLTSEKMKAGPLRAGDSHHSPARRRQAAAGTARGQHGQMSTRLGASLRSPTAPNVLGTQLPRAPQHRRTMMRVHLPVSGRLDPQEHRADREIRLRSQKFIPSPMQRTGPGSRRCGATRKRICGASPRSHHPGSNDATRMLVCGQAQRMLGCGPTRRMPACGPTCARRPTPRNLGHSQHRHRCQ